MNRAADSRSFGELPRLLLSYDEVALRLGVSNRTVRELVYQGVIPSVRIGSRRLIALADVESFVAGLRAGETGRGALS